MGSLIWNEAVVDMLIALLSLLITQPWNAAVRFLPRQRLIVQRQRNNNFNYLLLCFPLFC